MNIDKGYFIVLEGPDGAGKSLQGELLKKYIESGGHKVLLTKEPTNTSAASLKIADVIVRKQEIDPYELNKLFADDRREHLEKEIRPALMRGEIVIGDRYFFSSFAYGALGCDLEAIIDLNKSFLKPDLTILLLVSPETCMNRLKKRSGDNLEFYESLNKLKKIVSNYKGLIDRYPDIRLVDGEKSIEEVHQEIVSLLPKGLRV